MSPEKDLDDNCDVEVDNNSFEIGGSYAPKGACGKVEGHKECLGTNATICDTAPGGSKDASVSEVCDGKDDDCDGEVNEVAFSVVGGVNDQTVKSGNACSEIGEWDSCKGKVKGDACGHYDNCPNLIK